MVWLPFHKCWLYFFVCYSIEILSNAIINGKAVLSASLLVLCTRTFWLAPSLISHDLLVSAGQAGGLLVS